MQVLDHQMKRQQVVLKLLGYYNGPIDGVWGPDTIKAKKNFEHSGKFHPCMPNSGLPFAAKGPYPNGLYINGQGLLSIAGKEEDITAEETAAAAPKEVAPKVSSKESAKK